MNTVFTETDQRKDNVGTISGRGTLITSLTNVFHSQVSYRDNGGGVIFNATSQTGQMSPFVSQTQMPDPLWWDNFAVNFLAAEPAWTQDQGTKRLILNP